MSAPAPKTRKRKHVRVEKRRYEMVEFVPPMYATEDAEPFRFPKLKHLSQGLAIKMEEGNISALRDWLIAADVDEEDLEAFLDLDGEELQEFMKAWGAGELATAPKSSES